MGLDGVELIIAIEEEFGVDIPDKEAEKLLTVGDIFELLKVKIGSMEPSVCLTQRVFYKLRRALIENYGIQRNTIKLDTRMTDLLSLEEVEAGWPFLELFTDLNTPPFKVANEFLGLKLVNKELTMRELVQSLILINDQSLVPEPNSDEELWFRLVKIIMNQTNVRADEVRAEASLTRDLGID